MKLIRRASSKHIYPLKALGNVCLLLLILIFFFANVVFFLVAVQLSLLFVLDRRRLDGHHAGVDEPLRDGGRAMVVCEAFEVLSEENRAITESLIPEFVKAWAVFDPSGTGSIPVSDLEALVQHVPEPLGVEFKTHGGDPTHDVSDGNSHDDDDDDQEEEAAGEEDRTGRCVIPEKKIIL